MQHQKILATDLDGTLIPLDDTPDNLKDLAILKRSLHEHHVSLAFVSGRHLASIQDASKAHDLPRPDWIIADVGTSIYEPDDGGWRLRAAYRDRLETLTHPFDRTGVEATLQSFDIPRLQENVKQGTFKISYYIDANEMESVVTRIRERLRTEGIPYDVVESVDPFKGDGLIDVLPHGVTKAFAVECLAKSSGVAPQTSRLPATRATTRRCSCPDARRSSSPTRLLHFGRKC